MYKLSTIASLFLETHILQIRLFSLCTVLVVLTNDYIIIYRNLNDDPDCSKYLPLNPETRDLYVKTSDGIMYW